MMMLIAKIIELVGKECKKACTIAISGDETVIEDSAVARLVGAAVINEVPLQWHSCTADLTESLAKRSPEVLLHCIGRESSSAERLLGDVISVTSAAMSEINGMWWLPKGLLLSVKEGQASEGFGRSSSIGTTVDKCWTALARVSTHRSPRRVLMNLMRESASTEGTDLRVSAILYGVSVVLEETLYHQITARDVEAVMGGIAVLGDDTYCSERCRVLLSLHHALVPSIPPNGVIVCGLYGAMIRLGIRLLEDDSSEDAALYGFALLWSVLSSAPPEWLVSTLGLVGVRATSALRRAGKRKRDEAEELGWIPYLARYLEKLTRTVPTAALRKYSPIIAAELVSRYWSVDKKQRTASNEENLADDKVDEIIASTLYPLLCEGSTATRRSSGEAISYKSDDVLHLFASAGSDSSREKVKRMLQMYTQRFRYKGRV
ncbi:hypothetical protein Pmar_PMAR021389 [Perkinsus marinus ATCC 50983]|uniref:Uncharacterized protein n=1 Tax=Perkinsus marinus (strain ATCC 50983 / TXsc) TaxID=423536 RepID=C5KX58_PERM5|nr:hypothetical protein Pmar_PMAR021389 [Perkinsus marinus ATCC 50983]EER10914.1 hypothetical protein Pmar_PMAR021389 [Perkinsus marinus ATCC 50983]|eukprot:XP_002779119.1 hypothetical protein Pmar_PMAR021389 [Perkinsus marinus ATCC 50983]